MTVGESSFNNRGKGATTLSTATLGIMTSNLITISVKLIIAAHELTTFSVMTKNVCITTLFSILWYCAA